jgi:uncharacterized protein (UPF0216 family)
MIKGKFREDFVKEIVGFYEKFFETDKIFLSRLSIVPRISLGYLKVVTSQTFSSF